MKNETPALTENGQMTTKDLILYGSIGLVVIGGSFFIGRSLLRSARATIEEKKTYEEGSPATFAKQIKMAFDNDTWFGWGTDEDRLRKVILAIPSKDMMRQTINSYQKLYARSMMNDMQEELTTSEYSEMLSIIAIKPETGNSAVALKLSTAQYQSWAKRLNAAFNLTYGFIPGTDEDAIKAVFNEMPTQAAFVETGKVYEQIYGVALMKELRTELEIWEYYSYMDIITKKPKV
jgi:hypothetical protein